MQTSAASDPTHQGGSQPPPRPQSKDGTFLRDPLVDEKCESEGPQLYVRFAQAQGADTKIASQWYEYYFSQLLESKLLDQSRRQVSPTPSTSPQPAEGPARSVEGGRGDRIPVMASSSVGAQYFARGTRQPVVLPDGTIHYPGLRLAGAIVPVLPDNQSRVSRRDHK